jgi:hypothetical protein
LGHYDMILGMNFCKFPRPLLIRQKHELTFLKYAARTACTTSALGSIMAQRTIHTSR